MDIETFRFYLKGIVSPTIQMQWSKLVGLETTHLLIVLPKPQINITALFGFIFCVLEQVGESFCIVYFFYIICVSIL